MADAEDSPRNWLLRAVAFRDRAFLDSRFEFHTLSARTIVAESNQPIAYVYFPETAVLSVISHLEGGTVEVGTVGVEGMSGLPVLLGAGREPLQVICQIPGTAWRIKPAALLELFQGDAAISRLLLRYAHAFFMQVAQTAACNGAHSIEQRCARWLLMTHDRVGEAEFPVTHQFLAFMLGVRRAGVTVAMRALQRNGVVEYRRGNVRIADRAGLEAQSCECYETVRAHYARLLGTGTPGFRPASASSATYQPGP